MKKVNIKIAGLALLAAIGFTACSTDFLEEKQNYDNTTPEGVYSDYTGSLGRVHDCYSFCLPNASGTPGWQHPSTGKADDWSKCTEEYSGFGIFVDPQNELNTLTGTSTPDYYQGADVSNIQNNVWGLIRNINDAIIGIEGGSLSQDQKDELLGQLYFLRAWRYFLLWKWYGGVPIIKDLPSFDGSADRPRNTAREVFEFIIDDLDKAADMLEPFTGRGQWTKGGDNYGRVTTGSALGLKTRVLVWWCSPLFNRENDVERYKAAYEMVKADFPRIVACGYGQSRPSDGTSGWGQTIKDWANQFNVVGTPAHSSGGYEEVFFARFNDLIAGTDDYSRNNNWEHSIRPSNVLGGGGQTPSAMIVDLFPMADGKRPASYDSYGTTLQASNIAYDKDYPFLNRDLRFYRTFGFPGLNWPFSGNSYLEGKNMNPQTTGVNYILWNYVWYIDPAKVDDPNASETYGADYLLRNAKGMYVTKRSGWDKSTYTYCGLESTGVGFKYSYQNWIELRFTEVLLNLAELACGAGELGATEFGALKQLQKVRATAGYAENSSLQSKGTALLGPEFQYDNYGLAAGVGENAQATMAAILYERQIEFAFEGKRFDDMRRWLLFDGGVGLAGIGAKPLNGWGGNTCTYLDFKPFNGQRRGNMEFQVKPSIKEGVGGKEWPVGNWDATPDPVAQHYMETNACDYATFESWRNGLAIKPNNMGRHDNTKLDTALEKLKTDFYEPYLQRKDKKGDALNSDQTTTGMTITFLPRYYFLGVTSTVQAKNPNLKQTIGWEDVNGSSDLFDPLAE